MSKAAAPSPAPAGRLVSPRQARLLADWEAGRLGRINVYCGSVRSGKTWGSLLLWALWARHRPPGEPLLMVGKTLATLQRNCLGLLPRLAGGAFAYTPGAARGRLYGHEILLAGAADARAEGKIRGLTLGGAYVDELSLVPPDFFAMLLSRLSAPGAKLFATTNPENPGHWLKQRYLDRAGALDLRLEHFSLEDNIFLDAGYVAALKAAYTGALYQRFVLGQWVAAQGAVYPLFANDSHRFFTRRPRFDFIQCGIDFGGSQSAFAFVACGICRDFAHLTALCSRRVPAQGVSPEDMYRHVLDFLAFVQAAYGPVRLIYADCAEQTLINGLRRRLPMPVRGSLKRPILQRVRGVNLLLAQRRLWLTRHCQSLAGALQNALYNPRSQADERLDDGSTDIDSLDAFEYAFERYLTPYTATPPQEDCHDF